MNRPAGNSMSDRPVLGGRQAGERHITRAGQGGGRDVFEYALLRVVPRVERGECINAGVVVYCRARSYVGARTHLDEARLLALDPAADVAGVRPRCGPWRRCAPEARRPGRRAATTPGDGSAGLSRPARRSCSPGRSTPV